jgi:hypothetical protein
MAVAQLTKQEWKGELEEAILDLGSHWRVNKAGVEQLSPMCYAELADTKAGKLRLVSVARDRFPTARARIAEIARQLQAGAEPPRQ